MDKFSPLPRAQTQHLDLSRPAHSPHTELERSFLAAGEDHGSTASRAAGTTPLRLQRPLWCHRMVLIYSRAELKPPHWCLVHEMRGPCPGSQLLTAGVLAHKAGMSEGWWGAGCEPINNANQGRR